MANVLIFIGSLTAGGAERVTATLARDLVENGYVVTVATMGADRDFYPLDYRVVRRNLDLAGRRHGLQKVVGNLRRVAALRALVKRENVDVVVGMMWSGATFALLACLGLQARVITAERNYPGRKRINGWWALVRKWLYRFADGHVAQTREAADWLRRRAGARNIHVIPNAVAWPVPDCPPCVAPDTVLDVGCRLVLAVGSKTQQKGFDLLLPAFASAAGGREDWHLVILGLEAAGSAAPDPRDAVRARAEELGVAGCVHLPGRVGNMTEWYRRADIFVLSSRYEGFPNALLEAMAGGCASVSFDCDTGPRDIIDHERNGLLVPAEDATGLADGVRRLMNSPDLRRRLAGNAVAVRETFSEERVYGLWQEAIDRAVHPRL